MKKTIRKVIESILTFCARLILFRHHPTIIAITGSAGKTTTKQTVGVVLEEGFGRRNVLVGFGNLGTVAGIPLSLLNMRVKLLDARPVWGGIYLTILTFFALIKTIWLVVWPWYPRFVVLELTADRPGDLHLIASYLKPDIGVVTNIGPAHLEHFKTLENIVEEKAAVVKWTKENGLVILNARDERTKALQLHARAKIHLVDAKPYEFAPAVASVIGINLGLSEASINRGLKKFVSPKGRFDILKGKNDTTLIDSTYNANPTSTKAALERTVELATGRKIAVLGDMLELGASTKGEHIEVGRLAKALMDYVITVGPSSRVMDGDYATDSSQDAVDHLLKLILPGDTIVVKGSHGMHLEKVVQALRA